MKHIFSKPGSILFVYILCGIFGFSSYVFSWVAPWGPPTGINAPAPINTSSDPQIKGGYLPTTPTDASPLPPDPKVTLRVLQTSANTAGLFTEGFLSLGNIPTFGFISANVAKVTGTDIDARSPISLLAGNTPDAINGSVAEMANIVLMDNGSSHTKRLGVWSDKDNNWANTRVKNAYFSKLLITDPIFGGDIAYREKSFTQRFLGYVGVNDHDTYIPAPFNSTPNPTTCTIGTNGDKSICQYGPNGNNAAFELVPADNLDVAGKTNIGFQENGNPETCIIRKEDECPKGTYLIKIANGPNNKCRSFGDADPSKCNPTNPPHEGLNDTIVGGFGNNKTGWVAVQSASSVWNNGFNPNECNAVSKNDIISQAQNLGDWYMFPNDDPVHTLQPGATLYKDKYMMDELDAGVWHYLIDPTQANHAVPLTSLQHLLMNVSESGRVLNIQACP